MAAANVEVLAVRVGAAGTVQEHLTVVACLHIVLPVTVANITTNLQEACLAFLLVVLPSHIGSVHIAGGDTLTSTAAPSSASASRERIIVHVVSAADERKLLIIGETADICLCGVSVFRTVAQVHVDEPAFLHALLHGKVEHCLLLAVVNTTDAAIVALLVVRLYLLHHLRGDVLHRHLGVVREEFLTSHHNLADSLSVYLDGSVVLNLGTG